MHLLGITMTPIADYTSTALTSSGRHTMNLLDDMSLSKAKQTIM